MKKSILIAILLVSCKCLTGQTLNRPESIIYDSAHERYLISNYADGLNGEILAYDPVNDEYSYFNREFTQGPKGLAIFNNTLYVSDNGYVNGFNLDSGQRTFFKQVGTLWINDLAVDQEGFLYLGERDQEIIYKINTANGATSEWITGNLDEINGLWVDEENNRLIGCFSRANSPIMAFDLTTREATTLAETEYSICDGIAVDNCGSYYISSHAPFAIFCFDKNFSEPLTVFTTEVVSPADIFFNQELQVLCIPEINSNNILFVEMFLPCVTPQLQQPENEQEDVSFESLMFSWDSISRADYYRFELAKDSTFIDIISVDGTGVPAYQIDLLDPSSTYYWRVSAYKQNQHTEYSEVWSFTTAGSSSINSHKLSDTFRLYPNPSSGSVTLSWTEDPPCFVQLFNSIGKLNYEQSLFEGSTGKIQIEGLPSGVYFCHILKDKKILTQKLIVE